MAIWQGLLFSVIVVFGPYALLCCFLEWRYVRRVKRPRKAVTFESFYQMLSSKGYSREAIELAWQDTTSWTRHPILPADRFYDTFGMTWEEFDPMAEERCRKLGVEDIYESPYTSEFPIDTVEDYVRLLSAILRGERDKAREVT
jgi:hypothetical protein